MSAPECSEYGLVLLFSHNFMLFRKGAQNTRESTLQCVKDATSPSCVQLFGNKIQELLTWTEKKRSEKFVIVYRGFVGIQEVVIYVAFGCFWFSY